MICYENFVDVALLIPFAARVIIWAGVRLNFTYPCTFGMANRNYSLTGYQINKIKRKNLKN